MTEIKRGVSEEKYLTPVELAKRWALSPDTIRRLFCGEPDVLLLKNSSARSKRRYSTLRIPESVVERVRRKLSIGEQSHD